MPRIENIPRQRIRVECDIQMREGGVETQVVLDYQAAFRDGATLPPLIVFFDGADYWLADGFHRFEVALFDRVEIVTCEVHDGGLREALLYACGANAEHGLRRTAADKRKAVTTVLTHPLLSRSPDGTKWGNRQIARICKVGDHLVAEIRNSLEEGACSRTSEAPQLRAYTTKDGRILTQPVRTGGRAAAPPRPEERSNVRPLFAETPQNVAAAQADAENHHAAPVLEAIELTVRLIEELCDPGRAVAKLKPRHRAHLSVGQIRGVARWLSDFADTLDGEEGGIHVVR